MLGVLIACEKIPSEKLNTEATEITERTERSGSFKTLMAQINTDGRGSP